MLIKKIFNHHLNRLSYWRNK